MRYRKDHKQPTNQRILRASGRLFRKQGYAATGVDAVMKSAYLTAGGFYSHFHSKEELLAETLDPVFRGASADRPPELSKRQGQQWLRASPASISAPSIACGCPVPALAAKVRPRLAEERGRYLSSTIVGSLKY
jgi:TetR/AcrR family transcriptional repressor of nem operon